MQTLHLGFREGSQLTPVISTHILFAIIGIVKGYAKIPAKKIIKTETHNGHIKEKNTIGKKVTALNARNSARH
jgi:hypothetical protein